MDVAVVGAGSWGTALAKVLASKSHGVTLWGHTPSHVAEIAAAHENARYLPGVTLPSNLTTEIDLEKAVAGKAFVVTVVPSHTMREGMSRAAAAIAPAAVRLSAWEGS